MVFLLFLDDACFSLFSISLSWPSLFYLCVLLFINYTLFPYINIQIYIYIYIWVSVFYGFLLPFCEYKNIYSRVIFYQLRNPYIRVLLNVSYLSIIYICIYRYILMYRLLYIFYISILVLYICRYTYMYIYIRLLPIHMLLHKTYSIDFMIKVF